MQTEEFNEFPLEKSADLESALVDIQLSQFPIIDNYLFVSRSFGQDEGGNVRSVQHQFVTIYDLDSMEVVYEGRIRLRHDQGFVGFGPGMEGFSFRELD